MFEEALDPAYHKSVREYQYEAVLEFLCGKRTAPAMWNKDRFRAMCASVTKCSFHFRQDLDRFNNELE